MTGVDQTETSQNELMYYVRDHLPGRDNYIQFLVGTEVHIRLRFEAILCLDYRIP